MDIAAGAPGVAAGGNCATTGRGAADRVRQGAFQGRRVAGAAERGDHSLGQSLEVGSSAGAGRERPRLGSRLVSAIRSACCLRAPSDEPRRPAPVGAHSPGAVLGQQAPVTEAPASESCARVPAMSEPPRQTPRSFIHGPVLRPGLVSVESGDEQPLQQLGVPPETADRYRRCVLALFRAAAFEDPQATLRQVYEEALPTQEEFGQWVATVVAPNYLEAMRKVAFLSVVKVYADSDDDLYIQLYDFAFQEEERRHIGGQWYARLAEDIPPFEPVSVQEYYSRFVEYPEKIHQRALDLAELWARKRVREKRSEPAIGV